jgi:hypothetical protein
MARDRRDQSPRSGERSRAAHDANVERALERRYTATEHTRGNRAATSERRSSAAERARREREVSLLDMIDRLLAGGVVVHGDITLAVADVDLLYVGLRAVIASVDKVERDLIGPLDRPRKG